MKKQGHSILLTTAYLPPIEYFAYIIKADKVYIEKHENYTKQSYRNRCSIYSANGRLSLSIPVIKGEKHKSPVTEVQISNHSDWQKNHWRAIESAYNSSPFLLYYKDDLRPCFEEPFSNLFDFNQSLINILKELTGIKKELHFTSEFKNNPAPLIDLRERIHPKSNTSELLECNSYTQVFGEKYGFISGLSIIDLLFNVGPESLDYLSGYAIRI